MDMIIFTVLPPLIILLFYVTSPLLLTRKYKGVNNRLIDELSALSNTDVKVKLKDDPEVNAISYPNGVVVVTLGLLQAGDEYLRAALAHEIGHIRGRHSLKTLLLTLALVTLSIFLLTNVSLALGLTLTIGSILLLRYVSRMFEYSADSFAARLVGEASYTSLLLRYMNPNEKSWILSSHPTIYNRLKRIARSSGMEIKSEEIGPLG
ncbi:M48 family metalloprotease [Metallosphaera tengchongensis]|uniref:M48 family metalloprotease n=1 Tax=Metallosphaera tengchongensis TaxID=1532350 RepID=A0A6N0NV09_9CREN|nr:M48 family metalloprotease [Metallosphaera tengchongensis]QKR00015.1 M48 family metalloprotease [Metallosphaera tengchongensis]